MPPTAALGCDFFEGVVMQRAVLTVLSWRKRKSLGPELSLWAGMRKQTHTRDDLGDHSGYQTDFHSGGQALISQCLTGKSKQN